MCASPAVAQGVAPGGAVGGDDEARAVFATNANVPADGEGREGEGRGGKGRGGSHHAAGKAGG